MRNSLMYSCRVTTFPGWLLAWQTALVILSSKPDRLLSLAVSLNRLANLRTGVGCKTVASFSTIPLCFLMLKLYHSKGQRAILSDGSLIIRHRATFPQCSILADAGLNFCVRDENRCDPSSMGTDHNIARNTIIDVHRPNKLLKYTTYV